MLLLHNTQKLLWLHYCLVPCASLFGFVCQVLDDVAPTQDPDAMQDGDTAAEADLSQPLAKQKLLYCERFVEFLTDLLSQLPTRRFIRTLLEDRAILTKCRMSALFQNPQGTLQQCHSQHANAYMHS